MKITMIFETVSEKYVATVYNPVDDTAACNTRHIQDSYAARGISTWSATMDLLDMSATIHNVSEHKKDLIMAELARDYYFQHDLLNRIAKG